MEKLYGLIGEKLGHTYSPKIHREILKQLNLEGHYGLFEVKRENLKYVVSGLKALSYDGVNITIPYKTELIKYVDNLSPEAEKIGAINVINIDRNGVSTGFNTDYFGFGMMLKNSGINVEGEGAVVMGTGGASKSVIQYLKDNKIADIIIVSRNINEVKQKYPKENIITYNEFEKLENYSLIINATPIGMYPNVESSPIDKRYLKKFSSAIDLIYNPLQTLFLRDAEKEGLKTSNGLYMLVAQAVKSQEIWNDIIINEDVIDNIIKIF